MDSMPSVLPVNQAEAARDAARRQAIFSGGHKFIWLTLLNTRYRTMSGIDIVHATPYVDEQAGGITRFHLEVRGGHTDFQFDPSRGVFRYALLDCEHNRQFLASHFHLEFWRVEDEAIEADIEERSVAIEKQVKQEDTTDEPEDDGKPGIVRHRGRAARRRRSSTPPASAPTEAMGIQSDIVSVNTTRVVAP